MSPLNAPVKRYAMNVVVNGEVQISYLSEQQLNILKELCRKPRKTFFQKVVDFFRRIGIVIGMIKNTSDT